MGIVDVTLKRFKASLHSMTMMHPCRAHNHRSGKPSRQKPASQCVFAVIERACWKGWFVPPRASQTVSTPPYREERLVTPLCREERLVTPPCREERLIRTRRSVSLHTIACRLHACSASCYTLVTRLLHARTECCCTLISRLVALL
jgi:hypothetical protein